MPKMISPCIGTGIYICIYIWVFPKIGAIFGNIHIMYIDDLRYLLFPPRKISRAPKRKGSSSNHHFSGVQGSIFQQITEPEKGPFWMFLDSFFGAENNSPGKKFTWDKMLHCSIVWMICIMGNTSRLTKTSIYIKLVVWSSRCE